MKRKLVKEEHQLRRTARQILRPDRSFYLLSLAYAVGIGLLSVAVPLAVQWLINTVANTSLIPMVVVISSVLGIVLGLSAVLNGFQYYVMELFERRFYARVVADIALRCVHAQQSYFNGINRAALVNRYFEIMHVQKIVPTLLTGGVAVALQSVVGLVIVSFYHPFLLLFNVLFVLILLVIWRVWSPGAIRAAQTLSDSKYATAQWLEELARCHPLFKSESSIFYALERTNSFCENYLKRKSKMFRYGFGQTIALLVLYALASALLLGLGGALVTQNQLSLGQLVAAELIMSAIFYGISKIGYYLVLYYELLASCEKISYFYDIPVEDLPGTQALSDGALSITLDAVVATVRDRTESFHLSIAAGASILVCSTSATRAKLFCDLVRQTQQPEQGRVLLGGQDVSDCHVHRLRDKVAVLDSSLIVEGTVEEYLSIAAPAATRADMMHVLAMVELERILHGLPDGLETMLTPGGYPLSQSEVIRLKLAAALLQKPQVLLVTEVLDGLGYHQRLRILKRLSALADTTLVCFTHRNDAPCFDSYLFFDEHGMHAFATLEALREYETTHLRDGYR